VEEQNFSPFWLELTRPTPGRLPRVAFADSLDPRILKALPHLKNVAEPILLEDPAKIKSILDKLQLPALKESTFILPSLRDKREHLASLLRQKQEKLEISQEDARRQTNDSLYLGISLLLDGTIDGLVAGSTRPTADVVKASLHCIGPKPGTHVVSGQFFIESTHLKTANNTPFLFADCAVVPEPSSRVLADIALGAAASYKYFTGEEPRMALLSFSTRGSAQHPLVDRVREAVALIHKKDPALIVDGEIQADAALDKFIAEMKKAQDSPISGSANIFIFPTLEAGNIGYKLLQRFAAARVAGPLLWGLQKPVSDLSRGCNVQEVVDTALCVAAMIKGRS